MQPKAGHRTWGPRRARRRPAAWAFVLLEVLVSVAILGGSLAVILRGLTMALRTIEDNRVSATALALAQRLLDEYEVEAAPRPGKSEGQFGDAFPHFHWSLETRLEEPRYDDIRSGTTENELASVIRLDLTIYYQPEGRAAQTALEIDSAVTQMERFTRDARMRCGLFAHEEGSRRRGGGNDNPAPPALPALPGRPARPERRGR